MRRRGPGGSERSTPREKEREGTDGTVQIADTVLRYDRERVFRRLRICPGTEVYERCVESFPALSRIADRTIQIRCGYHVSCGKIRVGVPEVDGCAYQIVCLASCGGEIEGEIRRLMDRGEMLEGYLLSELANDALFDCAGQMDRQIGDLARSAGCRLSHRAVPGEGKVDLRCLAALLAPFREEPSLRCVTLNEAYMLVPERSMLYLFGAGPGLPEISVDHDCGRCSNLDCAYRMDPGGAAGCTRSDSSIRA